MWRHSPPYLPFSQSDMLVYTGAQRKCLQVNLLGNFYSITAKYIHIVIFQKLEAHALKKTRESRFNPIYYSGSKQIALFWKDMGASKNFWFCQEIGISNCLLFSFWKDGFSILSTILIFPFLMEKFKPGNSTCFNQKQNQTTTNKQTRACLSSLTVVLNILE